MVFQDIMAIIQTCIGIASLIISVVTLSKVNQINVKKRDTIYTKQTSIGKNNIQNAKKDK